MYHPHADEMVQMGLGMMGLFIVHPKDPALRRVDRDFGFLMANYEVKPGTYVPDTSVMLEFNTWAWNSRVFPGIDPLVVRKGDRVRIRIGNLTMTNHPIHLHGYDFRVTGTDGGWVPESAQWPEVTVDVAVGQMRAIEFVADAEGDWAFHCHKSHHTMGPMGHEIANMVGVRQGVATKRITKLLPDYMYMPMGEAGMAEMQDMAAHGMTPPENTLPDDGRRGPFGPIEMGGMFTVREGPRGRRARRLQRPRLVRAPRGHGRLQGRRDRPAHRLSFPKQRRERCATIGIMLPAALAAMLVERRGPGRRRPQGQEVQLRRAREGERGHPHRRGDRR